jgi:hypothetical protein
LRLYAPEIAVCHLWEGFCHAEPVRANQVLLFGVRRRFRTASTPAARLFTSDSPAAELRIRTKAGRVLTQSLPQNRMPVSISRRVCEVFVPFDPKPKPAVMLLALTHETSPRAKK